MKNTFGVAAAVAVVGVSHAEVVGKHTHGQALEKRMYNTAWNSWDCPNPTPSCTTIYYTVTGEPTYFLRPTSNVTHYAPLTPTPTHSPIFLPSATCHAHQACDIPAHTITVQETITTTIPCSNGSYSTTTIPPNTYYFPSTRTIFETETTYTCPFENAATTPIPVAIASSSSPPVVYTNPLYPTTSPYYSRATPTPYSTPSTPSYAQPVPTTVLQPYQTPVPSVSTTPNYESTNSGKPCSGTWVAFNDNGTLMTRKTIYANIRALAAGGIKTLSIEDTTNFFPHGWEACKQYDVHVYLAINMQSNCEKPEYPVSQQLSNINKYVDDWSRVRGVFAAIESYSSGSCIGEAYTQHLQCVKTEVGSKTTIIVAETPDRWGDQDFSSRTCPHIQKKGINIFPTSGDCNYIKANNGPAGVFRSQYETMSAHCSGLPTMVAEYGFKNGAAWEQEGHSRANSVRETVLVAQEMKIEAIAFAWGKDGWKGSDAGWNMAPIYDVDLCNDE